MGRAFVVPAALVWLLASAPAFAQAAEGASLDAADAAPDTAEVEAEDAPEPEVSPPSQPCDCPKPRPCREQSLVDGEAARGPMGDFGLTLKTGVAGRGERTYRVDGQDVGTVGSRAGYLLGLVFNTGDGHGFGSDIGFTMRRYQEGGVKLGTFTIDPILGGRFHMRGPAYLFVGVGPSLGLGFSDAPNSPISGVAGFRVPVQATVYFWRKLAAVVELGLGWDAWVTGDPDPGMPNDIVAFVNKGMTWDLAFGIRFF